MQTDTETNRQTYRKLQAKTVFCGGNMGG